MSNLYHLALIWVGVFGAMIAARALRMTPVVFYLVAGSLFANLGWLPAESGEFVRGLSELGILAIMFVFGFEESTSDFLHSIKRSWGIAFFGALAPFCAAFGLAFNFFGSFDVALLCGLTMTATAVSLTLVALKSEGLGDSPVATRIMTSAVIDDIASLVLVAIMVPAVTGSGEGLSFAGTGLVVAKAALFFVVVVLLGVLVFPDEGEGWAAKIPLLGRFGLRQLLAFAGGKYATLQVLLLAVLSALIGHGFGFHPAVGAYMAGLIIRREYFRDGGVRGSFRDTQRILDNAAFVWLGPVFFVELGTKLIFEGGASLAVIPMAAALTLGVAGSQVLAASLAARYTGGMRPAASLMVGFGMLGRAELAFVVLDIAYVQNPILSTEAFYTLMFTCFLLNIAVPILIHWWKPRYAEEEGIE